jgi:polyisoprenoid-binding protein YceI
MRSIALGFLLLAAPASPGPVELRATEAQVQFYLSAAGLLEEGEFERVEAHASFVGDRMEALDVVVHVDSLHTAIPKMTQHLLSAEVLDVARHPTATFHMVSAQPEDPGEKQRHSRRTHALTGEMTIKGVKRSMTVPVTAHVSESTFHGHTTLALRPSDFGIQAIRWTDPEVELSLRLRFDR